MTHHRCTRCKQESYPRHKYYGGVFCDDCINEIRGRHFGKKRNVFWRLWDKLCDWVDRTFRPQSETLGRAREERRIHTQLKVMEARARKMPRNPQQTIQQKH